MCPIIPGSLPPVYPYCASARIVIVLGGGTDMDIIVNTLQGQKVNRLGLGGRKGFPRTEIGRKQSVNLVWD